jgi:hypothetical protein
LSFPKVLTSPRRPIWTPFVWSIFWITHRWFYTFLGEECFRCFPWDAKERGDWELQEYQRMDIKAWTPASDTSREYILITIDIFVCLLYHHLTSLLCLYREV